MNEALAQHPAIDELLLTLEGVAPEDAELPTLESDDIDG